MTEKHIVEASNRAADKAVPELEKICVDAINRHNLGQVRLPQSDMIRVGLVINEVQQQSFSLGVRIGLSLLHESLTEAD